MIGTKFIDAKVNPLFTNLVKITSESVVRPSYVAQIYRAQMGLVGTLALVKVLIALCLVFWMAVSLSSIFWRLFPEPELSNIVTPFNAAAFAPVNTNARPSVDINKLKSIELFGKESADVPITVAEVVEISEKVEETRLNLKLVGSFANTNKDLGYAIIAKGRDQDLYKVGDEILGLSNVKLIGVYSERVILSNKGRQEALYMYPEGVSFASDQVASSKPASTKKQVSTPTDSSNSAGDQRLKKMSDAIRFSRKTKDGKMLGFRVLPGRNRKAFEQTGLQLNDIVTAIDGQTLDNLKTANSIYQEKRNATQASLSVLRGSEELTIDIDLDNINLN